MNKLLKTMALLSLIMFNAYGQTQLKNWSIGGHTLDMTNTSTSAKSTIPIIGDYIRNAMYDGKGNALFYVSGTKIYDSKGGVVTTFAPLPGGTIFPNLEYPIVPCINSSSIFVNSNNVCEKKFYVFYTINAGNSVSTRRLVLFAKIVTFSYQTGDVTAEDVTISSTNLQRRELVSAPHQGSAMYELCGLAVSRVNNNNKRFLYFVNEPYVRMIEISDLNNPSQGIGISSIIFSRANDPGFSFGTSQANLSVEGNKLTWGVQLTSTLNNYFVLGINSNTGLWNGSVKNIFQTNQTTSHFSSVPYLGAEFSADGNKLYMTTGCTTRTDDGIYVKDLTNSNALALLANSRTYGRSQLELGFNGNVYAANDIGVSSIATNNNQFPVTPKNYTNATPISQNTFLLPDQIDGENYNSYVPDYYDIKDMTISGGIADEVIYWSQTNNPINNSGQPIRISGTLTFTGSGIYALNNMQFEFGENGKIVIESGATMRIDQSILKATSCAKFWQGIEVKNTGYFGLTNTFINDAVTAISTKGGHITVSRSIFNANQTHINIEDFVCIPSISNSVISENQFLQTIPLKLSGSIYNGKGIVLSTTKTYCGVIELLNNYFEGCNSAIQSTKMPFKLMGINTFKNITGANGIAIKIDMQNLGYNAEIGFAVFDNVTRAVYASNKTNLRFENNTINNTKGHAVESYKNNNCNLSFKNNTFTRFYKGAILLNTNGGSTPDNLTKVNISGNTFDNTAIANTLNANSKHVPTAITIDETGLSKTQNFTELRVTNNTITNAAYGIKTSNVKGYQLTNKPYDRFYNTDRKNISDIDNNTIKVFATYTTPQKESDINSGVQVNNSMGLRMAVNTISTNKPTIWRNRGIHTYNTQQTLIHKNKISATGRGIAGEFSGMGNDMNCNTFTNVVNGISLKDFSMRSKGVTHGIKSKESRDNGYSSTAAEDIELYLHNTANPNNPQNVQQLVERNQWLMVQNPDVLIDPSPGPLTFLSYIKPAVFAPDLCNGFPDFNPGDIGNTMVFGIPAFTDNKMDYWQQQYNYERQKKDSGLVVNPFINALMDVEQLTTTGKDSAALVVLNTMTASEDVYEQNYITVYTILLTARLQGERELDSLEKAKLIAIAAQNTYTAGPSNFTARVILWQYEGLNFVDMEDRALGLRLKLDETECADSLPNDFTIRLKANNNYIYSTAEVPIQLTADGYIYIAANVLATLPTNMQYSFVYTGGEYVVPPYHTIADWMETSNLYLCLPYAVLPIFGFGKRGNTADASNTIHDAAKEYTTALAAAITIAPNPAKDAVTIQLPANTTYTVALYNVVGKEFYNHPHADTAIIDTHTYPIGVYLIKITDTTNNMVITKRLVIAK
jgi:hypothetical protein